MKKSMFKKMTLMMVAIITMIAMVGVSFAEDKPATHGESWAFYVYLIDNERSMEYNNSVINEIGQVSFGKNIKVVSETSWGSPFDSFMKYCYNSAKADHQVLIICGEGEGAYGIKKDKYSYTTLSDIRKGLERCYEKNDRNPAFELTLVDGSLMACVEMAEILDGYSKYLVASETYFHNVSGFYKKWFSDFVYNTNISAETLGKFMVDAYIEQVEKEMKSGDNIISTNLSLIDVTKLNNAFNSYKKLIKATLRRIPKDNLLLSFMSKTAKSTVTAADTGDTDFYFNMLDFYDFMYNLRKAFPAEAMSAMKYIKAAIKYKKEMGFVSNTCGAGIYFPMMTFAGHTELLNKYMENADKYLKIFYNYKMNGTISEDSAMTLKKDLKIKISNLNYKAIDEFDKITPILGNNLHFTVDIPNSMKELAQDAYLMIYKRDDGTFNLYNQDSYMKFDGNNNIRVMYNNAWDMLDDVPLPINILSKTKDYKKYFVNVLFNDKNSKLIVNYDENGEVPMIAGINVNNNVTRVMCGIVHPIKDGEPMGIYSRQLDVAKNIETPVLSTAFKYNSNYKIENKILPDGEYTMVVIYEDVRGVKRLSGNILFNIRDGALYQLINERDLMVNKD